LRFSRGGLNLNALSGIDLGAILILFSILLLSLTVHEWAHAWSADRLGDPTARVLGRVTLNPIAHIDPIGTIVFPLISMFSPVPLLGWAKPVPVDIRRLRNGRRDFVLVAAAGPASNLVMAVAAAALLGGAGDPGATVAGYGFSALLVQAVRLNVMLAVFNMLPIPPLDGGNVLSGLLPRPLAYVVDQIRPYGFILLYALILTGAFNVLVGTPYRYVVGLLL
jgi:Zn-dependent protease